MKTTKPKGEVKEAKKERYYESTGGRKTASARVRLFHNKTGVSINGKDLKTYFKQELDRKVATSPVDVIGMAEKFMISASVFGGGIGAQAEAIRNAIAKALVKFDANFRHQMRVSGFMTRDPRSVERKKYGLKKARRAPQWQKR